MARVDVSESHKWVVEEGLGSLFSANDLPAIVVMQEGKYYKFNADSVISGDKDDVSTLLHFINRLQHSYVTLDTQQDVE